MVSHRFEHVAAFVGLLREALGDELAPGIEDYGALFCDDGVLELPYGDTPRCERIEGRPAISEFMDALRGKVFLESMVLGSVHLATGGTTILEYSGRVLLEQRNVRFEQRYIAVVTIRDGHASLVREFTNPLLPQRALAGENA